MDLPSYFTDFLANIRPTARQIADFRKGHTLLRERLLADEKLAPCIVTTFLQGSYRRRTAIRPQGDCRPDVDVVVVTRLSRDEYTPEQAIGVFKPFMRKHYKDKYRTQGRSIGISLSYVDLDLVVTSAPSEEVANVLKQDERSDSAVNGIDEERLAEAWELSFDASMMVAKASEPQWKNEPLYIPDRELGSWEQTHPLAQMEWTRERNEKTSGHYINVVKALKWWRRVAFEKPKRPKGYPLERIVDECCPDGIKSIAEGVVLTLEAAASRYETHAILEMVPFLADRGVPQNNVLARIKGSDFAAFHNHVKDAADLARRAIDADNVEDSATLWRELFGDKFPKAPSKKSDSQKGGYTPREDVTRIGGGRFA